MRVLVTKIQKHVVAMEVLCFVGVESAEKSVVLGGIKIFRCTALLRSCLDIHPSEIQSHGTISE